MEYKADIYLVLPEQDYITYQWCGLRPSVQFLYENQLGRNTVLLSWKNIDTYSDYGMIF
jgi:hypothetical protein